MKVQFQYDKEKDIWCLLNKGKSSDNSQSPTKQYEQLITKYGKNPTSDDVSNFIEDYKTNNNIDTQQFIEKYQKDWEVTSNEFYRRAETIFNVSLPENITGYLTINSRCPYSIENNYFFVAMSKNFSHRTVMHELWHFYTWYGLDTDQEEKIGKQKYNDIKEALTVLLNIECKDLLPEGVIDSGYPQHQELRQNIVEFWDTNKDIKKLWDHFIKQA
ncbi:MAG: hypothetical protein RJA61_375 [Candidatus Parcubacteria bacterium]|jgi:hypothetical protein